MSEAKTSRETLREALRDNKLAQLGEIVLVFAVAAVVIGLGAPLSGGNPLAFQAVLWVANVLMLTTVWLGLRLRGQGWKHFGLSFRFAGWRSVARTLGLSLVVFVAAVAAFLLGAVIMSFIVGVPPAANMSGYHFLHGNLPLLIISLVGVYIVSSFGEEVIYRAFLINRIMELGSGGTAKGLAVVISSLVFGLAHLGWGLVGIVQTSLMGLALALFYLGLGRKLWVLILAHGYMDTLLLVQLYFAAPPI